MTHSTAEAELVSYCEGLIAGKAAEALVMELTGGTAVMKVIYGDNIAAIGLANGTTSSSWRTRHLRIRASLLKQALDETDAAGGQWKLIHVRGLDLVADGFTKPLFGAAFQRFVENLGMNAPFLRPEDPELRAAQVRSHGSRERVHAGAASAMSFLVGQTLLSEAEALEIKGEQDEADPLWIAAVVLMILGAIYAGKLAVQAGQCCMRRLQVWLSAPSTPSGEMQASSTCSTTKKDDENDGERRSALRWRSSTSSSGPVQAPSAGSSSYGLAQALSAGSSCGSGPVQAPMVRSLSSFGPVQASSSTSTGSITAERAGPEQAHFAGSGVGPEQAWRSTNAAAGASSSSAGLVQALRTMNAAVGASSSGAGPEQALRAGAGPVQAVVADDADLGPEQASSSSGAADLCADAEAAGLEQALRAAAGDGIERALRQRADEVREALRVGGGSKIDLHNPWNLFQHENRGKGWSPAKMSAMYKKWRPSEKDKMP